MGKTNDHLDFHRGLTCCRRAVTRRRLLAAVCAVAITGDLTRHAGAEPRRETGQLEQSIGARALQTLSRRLALTGFGQKLPLSRETREDLTAFLAVDHIAMPVRVPTMRDREIVFQLTGVLTDDPGFRFNVSMRQDEWGAEDGWWWMTKRTSRRIRHDAIDRIQVAPAHMIETR